MDKWQKELLVVCAALLIVTFIACFIGTTLFLDYHRSQHPIREEDKPVRLYPPMGLPARSSTNGSKDGITAEVWWHRDCNVITYQNGTEVEADGTPLQVIPNKKWELPAKLKEEDYPILLMSTFAEEGPGKVFIRRISDGELLATIDQETGRVRYNAYGHIPNE